MAKAGLELTAVLLPQLDYRYESPCSAKTTYKTSVSRLFDLQSPDFSASFQGIDEGPEGLKLISDIIREKMGIDISVLMGANIASEVAAEKFCETTIGEAAEGP